MKFKNIPWWTKILIKSSLGIIPLSYEKIRYWLTGYRGGMESLEYADHVFRKNMVYFPGFDKGFHGGVLLELGPGGSLLSGILGRISGFDKCILLDIGNFASKDFGLYKNLINYLAENDKKIFLENFKNHGNIIESFKKIGIIYLKDGFSSLSDIPCSHIDYSFSNAVIEHISKNKFKDTINELYRVHKPNTISTHHIDYKDHMSNSLNNLRFPSWLWENSFFPNSGFYTNRLRHIEVREEFEAAGFTVEHERIDTWSQVPLSKDKFASEFRQCEDDQLKICGGKIVVRKPG